MILGFAGLVLGTIATLGAYLWVAPGLPPVEALRDIRLQVPLRVFTRDGRLIAEYGEQRRVPVRYDDVPEPMIQAFLAAEDDRFFSHPGVDWQGLLRAAINLVMTGEKEQGGSTITMQVARNFFLSSEKTYTRKIREIFLALKIERELDKQQILELYLNKIFLGNRAYGVGAAAEVYYGKKIGELSLPEIATIAGIPKAPSRDNPVANPARSLERRGYVLGRMRDLGYIDTASYEAAMQALPTAQLHGYVVELEAPHIGEMVRTHMFERFGEAIYTDGYKVVTTLDSRLQPRANQALRTTLLNYDQRHAYRGPAARLELDEDWSEEERLAALDEILSARPAVNLLLPGVVVAVAEEEAEAQTADVYLGQGQTITLNWEGLVWAAADTAQSGAESGADVAASILAPGDIIYVDPLPAGGFRLAQPPEVQGALVALDPFDGAIVALAGGFDFHASKFNRAVQGQRQPGSAFKPFIYSAALDNGFTPATIVNDAPVVFEDEGLESVWRPENYTGRFYGPTRFREALVNSRNLVSIRVLREMGVGTTIGYLRKFGFDPARLPRNLSLALGSATLTPLELATGYAVIANGGYRVQPYFIDTILAADGTVLHAANPPVACGDCLTMPAPPPAPLEPLSGASETEAPTAVASETAVETASEAEIEKVQAPQPVPYAEQTLNPQNVYLITDMLRDVVRRGTGAQAMQLGRNDLAGKTGTTNDFRDAWFSGFNHTLVTTVWLGYDQARPLGEGEAGSRAALPMWIDFMRPALAGVPEMPFTQPPGLVTVRIDRENGLRVGAGHSDAIFETFRTGQVPELAAEGDGEDAEEKDSANDLF